MNHTTLLAAAVAAFAFATPAMAQDAGETQIATGPRVELLLGYDYVRADLIEPDGYMAGLGAGYDLAVSRNFSVGADVEASIATTEDDSLGVELEAGRDLYAGGRISLAITDNANVYVKGGYTNARLKADGFGGENFGGYRLGFGGEVAISGKIFLGAEYRYSNYESDITRHQIATKIGTRF